MSHSQSCASTRAPGSDCTCRSRCRQCGAMGDCEAWCPAAPPATCNEIRCVLPPDHDGPCDKRADPAPLTPAEVAEVIASAPGQIGPRSDPSSHATPRYTPGQLVLVTLRHRETGRRGDVREYEQRRLGEVHGYDNLAPTVSVTVPGHGVVAVPRRDVEDAMAEERQ